MKILITGGSKGLGLEMVKKLSKNQDHYIFTTYNNTYPSELENIKNVSLIKINFRYKKFPTDFDHIDCLINNYHSGYSFKHLSKFTTKEIEESFLNSVSPLIDLNNFFISKMKEKRNGIIISILSSSTQPPFKLGMGIYTAEKIYLKTLTEFWKLELERYGIKIINVSPGLIKTTFNSSMDKRIIENMEKKGEISKLDNVVNLIIKIIKNPLKYSKKENFI